MRRPRSRTGLNRRYVDGALSERLVLVALTTAKSPQGVTMLNSTVLEVAIGLVFCYCSVSLIASSINEALASLLKLRSGTLLDGVKSLLNDPGFTGLARDIYNHALVDPQGAGNANSEKELISKPSYIPSKQFALALIDILQKQQQASAEPERAFAYVQDPQMRQLFEGMYARATGDLDKFQAELAAWFDNGMERVGGGYKRRSQLLCFLIAFVVATMFNIDSIHLFKTLWEHPALSAEIAAPATKNVADVMTGLQALPIGWENFPPRWEFSHDTLIRLVGWLVTASSALFGAPFWFDSLQKIIQLRGTGKKPDVA